MTVLSAQSIRRACTSGPISLVTPFVEKGLQNGKSFGLSQCGYDIRIKTLNGYRMCLNPGGFTLASSLERIIMHNDLVAIVHDKSSWARQGLAIQNTVLEPGWEGWITLELTNHSTNTIWIDNGDPIAQLIFHKLDYPTEMPYRGKYQNQEDRPVEAIYEK